MQRPLIPNIVTLATTLLLTISTTNAADMPQWIWGSKDAQTSAADGECEFQRKFQLNSKPKSVIIEIAVDDQYTLRINNRYVAAWADVREKKRFDVTPIINKGENTVYVRCRNSGGPAGFCARIDIVQADGEKQTIVTNRQWRAKLQQAGTWDPSIRKRTPWHDPFLLGPQDMPPWSNIVKISTSVERVKPRAQSDGPFDLHDGDRVALLGNTFIERAQRYGYIEHELTRRFPHRNVVFRNLGWSGDTVFGEARARFGTTTEGFEQLETQVHLVEPTLILVAYGSNAAFAGPIGLDSFVAGYENLLNVLESTGARITLVSPMKHENLGAPLPDQTQYNDSLQLYRDAIQNLAQRRAFAFVDLYDLVDDSNAGSETLTDNGIHLTEAGYRFAARTLSDRLGISERLPTITIDAKSLKANATNATVDEPAKLDDGIKFLARLGTLPLPSVPDHDPPNALTLRIGNLVDGNYEIRADEQFLANANAAKLADGVTILRGPDVEQAESLLETIRKKNELFFHRWRPQNETYLFLFRKHEQGNNAVEIPKFDPLVAEQEALVATLRVPKSRSYTVRRK